MISFRSSAIRPLLPRRPATFTRGVRLQQHRSFPPIRFSSTAQHTIKTVNSSAAKPKSIPGPSWAWIEPLAGPFRAYGRMQARSPYVTQLWSALVIYWLGDLSAQLVANSMREDNESQGPDDDHRSKEERKEETEQKRYLYAPERGLRALVIGGIAAIPSYHWFLFLGRRFNYGSHALSIAVKIVVNQCVFTPIFNSYFFGMHSLLTGNGWEETRRRIAEAVPVSFVMSWKVWPVVTAFSFTFIAPQYRSVSAGFVAIGWQTYLSWLNGKAAKGKLEQERKALMEEKKGRSLQTNKERA